MRPSPMPSARARTRASRSPNLCPRARYGKEASVAQSFIPSGLYAIEVTACDAAGNHYASPEPIDAFFVDSVAPVLQAMPGLVVTPADDESRRMQATRGSAMP